MFSRSKFNFNHVGQRLLFICLMIHWSLMPWNDRSRIIINFVKQGVIFTKSLPKRIEKRGKLILSIPGRIGGAFISSVIEHSNLQNIGRNMGYGFRDGMRMVGDEFQDGIAGGVNEFENGMDRVSKLLQESLVETGEIFIKQIEKLGDKLIQKHYKKLIIYPTVGGFSLLFSWHGFKLSVSHINRFLQKPKVIIGSSRESWLQWFKYFIVKKDNKVISMVFSQKLEDRLKRVTLATKQINKRIKEGQKGIKYRNVLLYGPPGTGKTMFARKFSHDSGMEFVEITGSSLFQKGAGIGAIDELFTWAKKSRKGLCLFIDEADSLFINRETVSSDSENYRMVNHFLNYLGQRSEKFMVVMATNHHKNFDEAMHRRIDDMIEMPLPGEKERLSTLKHYKKSILMAKTGATNNVNNINIRESKKTASQLYRESVQKYVTDKKLEELAQQTEGFSYGDMHGIINKIKTDSFTTENGLVNPQLINQVVREYKEKFEGFRPKRP